jgi:hypothetical protein
MPCLLVLLIMSFPRIVLACMWFFTHMLERAYDGLLIPLLGFFLLPITTVVYAWLVSAHRPLEGINLIILIIAVVMDAGSHNGGRQYYQNR